MVNTFKIFAVAVAIAGAIAFSSAARADHVMGVTVGVSGGGNASPRPQPAYTSTYFSPAYSVPVYSQGAYIVPNFQQTYYTSAGDAGVADVLTRRRFMPAFDAAADCI